MRKSNSTPFQKKSSEKIEIVLEMAFVKDDIGIERKCVLENPIDEIIWVEIHAKGNTFLLGHTYRPPNYYVNYWTRYSHEIGLSLQLNKNIVLTGDLNCDLLPNHSNNKLIDIHVI